MKTFVIAAKFTLGYSGRKYWREKQRLRALVNIVNVSSEPHLKPGLLFSKQGAIESVQTGQTVVYVSR
jgi:hypothetical protein